MEAREPTEETEETELTLEERREDVEATLCEREYGGRMACVVGMYEGERERVTLLVRRAWQDVAGVPEGIAISTEY